MNIELEHREERWRDSDSGFEFVLRRTVEGYWTVTSGRIGPQQIPAPLVRAEFHTLIDAREFTEKALELLAQRDELLKPVLEIEHHLDELATVGVVKAGQA